MSRQTSFRLFLLFSVFFSFCQLGIAQASETEITYTAMNVKQAVAEVTVGYENDLQVYEVSSKPAYDFSQQATLPSFDGLTTYVVEHLQYPALAQANNVEGRVVLSLKLSSTGEVISAIVEESLGYGCDEAALALVNEMPRWNPASNYGVAVGAKQKLTIEFKL